MLPSLPNPAGNPTFLAPSTELVDVNHDGLLDALVANSNLANVTVMLGVDGGTFALGSIVGIDAGITPLCATAADMNHDGNVDLLTGDNTGHCITVSLGDGRGGFGTATSYPLPGSNVGNPHEIVVADVNADGNPDLIVADRANEVVVFLGYLDGGLAAPVAYSTGAVANPPPFTNGVVVDDFNHDGHLDIAASNQGGGANDTVSVLMGLGNGSFASHVEYPIGGVGNFLASGDFNHDGQVDLAVGVSATGGSIAVLLGLGDGGFSPASHVNSVGQNSNHVVAADLNHDGWLDLATEDWVLGEVIVVMGEPDGGFGSGTVVTSSPTMWGLAAGDVNRDGQADLLTYVGAADYSNQGLVLMLANGGSPALGTFTSEVSYSPNADGGGSSQLAMGDLNRDGFPDAVTLDNNNTVRVLLNNGVGGFVFLAEYPVVSGAFPNNLALVDVNRDGALDIVFSEYVANVIYVFLGNGDGTFNPTPSAFPAGDDPHWIEVADFNLDGIPDLAVSQFGNGFALLPGQPDGGFGTVEPFDAAGPGASTIASGDFNLDGKPDLVVPSYTSTFLTEMLNTGSGFASAGNFTVSSTPTLEAHQCAVGDFNRDGKPDVVTLTHDNAGVSTLSVLLGYGDGGFSPFVAYDNGSTDGAVGVADFNLDGIADLYADTGSPNGAHVFLGNGDGTFQPYVSYAAAATPFFVEVDANLDGIPDLVAATTDGSVNVLLGQTCLSSTAGTIPMNGLVAWYRTGTDLSGNGNNLTAGGRVGTTTDRFGNPVGASLFAPSSQTDGATAISGNNPLLPVGTSPRTISVWIQTTANYKARNLGGDFWNWGGCCTTGSRFGELDSPFTNAEYFVGQDADVSTGTKLLNDGNWHSVIVTYDGTTVTQYVDGIKDVSATPTLDTVGTTLVLGNAVPGHIPEPFIGALDDVLIYDRVLTSAELAQVYSQSQ